MAHERPHQTMHEVGKPHAQNTQQHKIGLHIQHGYGTASSAAICHKQHQRASTTRQQMKQGTAGWLILTLHRFNLPVAGNWACTVVSVSYNREPRACGETLSVHQHPSNKSRCKSCQYGGRVRTNAWTMPGLLPLLPVAHTAQPPAYLPCTAWTVRQTYTSTVLCTSKPFFCCGIISHSAPQASKKLRAGHMHPQTNQKAWALICQCA